MNKLKGISASGGIASGKLVYHRRDDLPVVASSKLDSTAELARFEAAREKAKRDLDELRAYTAATAGEKAAEIFDIHCLMLDDEDFCSAAREVIEKENVCAEYAVHTTGIELARMLTATNDVVMRERASDVEDIARRMIRILAGREDGIVHLPKGGEPVILAAEDFTPSETVRLDAGSVAGFVTTLGGVHSHTTILARSMGIPALVGVNELSPCDDGRMAILDGTAGTLFLDPDQDTLAAFQQRAYEEEARQKDTAAIQKLASVTRDGHKVKLYANIGAPGDIAAALAGNAAGIGLFRTEFLFLATSAPPSEEEQLTAYRTVLEAMEGKRVIIRTLDAGADKPLPYLNLSREENPALGCRGIRLCLAHPEVFKTQLRALYRASIYGRLAVLLPMIASVWEVTRTRALIREICAELEAEGHAYSESVEFGVMIETPASVLCSRELAKEVDFFSIGTNDLTQYTLAMDRQSSCLENGYNPYHPAILRSIQIVCDSAAEAGIRVDVCGELAADTAATSTLLALGVSELSVPPPYLAAVRSSIRECDLGVGREIIIKRFMCEK